MPKYKPHDDDDDDDDDVWSVHLLTQSLRKEDKLPSNTPVWGTGLFLPFTVCRVPQIR